MLQSLCFKEGLGKCLGPGFLCPFGKNVSCFFFFYKNWASIFFFFYGSSLFVFPLSLTLRKTDSH